MTGGAGMWGAQVIIILLIVAFGCVTLGDAASYSYPKLNAYSWTITTNKTLGSYADLVTPKIVLDDAPPPPSFAERAHNQLLSRERQEHYRKRVPIPNAVSDDVREQFLASREADQISAPTNAPSAVGGYLFRFSLYAALFVLLSWLALRTFAPEILVNIRRELNPWMLDPDKATVFSAKVRSEEEAFARFAAAFRVGPANQVASGEAARSKSQLKPDAMRDFIERTAGLLLAQRKTFGDIDRAWNDGARRKMVGELRLEVKALTEEANFPEVMLIWQVASAMDGLLKQLIDRAENISPSTLRTIRGGVDLLTDLCSPGCKLNLLEDRPLRFLAVDDDLISRQALSVALKKGLGAPDLAMDGQGGMARAEKQAYDVIFLDVQMPDMDGFELCTKIHQTEINRTTPVVFVTGKSDFDARAQSALSGGSDLMAKPFLTFEVTVKALTLALRGRLQENSSASQLTESNRVVSKARPEASPVAKPAPVSETVSVPPEAREGADLKTEAPADKAVTEFLARITKHLPALQKNCKKILETTEAKARQDNIADAFLRVHSFVPGANLASKHPAFQVSVALEGLLRKLLEDQKNCTDSAMETVSTAIGLLADLCAPHRAVDISKQRPVEILVVDDDVFCRRAISGALQLAFDRPLDVGSGEAALAITDDKLFDVIFMDVVMPGMDGFTACAKIRESGANRRTPVVFVTGQSDYATRAEMTRSGGSDLISKPFLPSEITVKALTFALRGRLQNQ